MTIHRGDPRERRLLAWVLVGAVLLALVGAWLLWQFRDAFMLVFAANREDGITMAQQVLRGLTVLVAAQALGIGWYLGRKAWRVRQLRVFPLPGSRTVLNVKVREGEEAARLGMLGLVAAGLFGVFGLVALWLGFR